MAPLASGSTWISRRSLRRGPRAAPGGGVSDGPPRSPTSSATAAGRRPCGSPRSCCGGRLREPGRHRTVRVQLDVVAGVERSALRVVQCCARHESAADHARPQTPLRDVRCGLRQLGINRLVANGIHEHPRVVMTNSMCNSGRDSTRPPGPATDRRRILTRDASTSRSHQTLRRMRVRPGDRGAHEAARHEPPGSDGRG